MRRAWLILLVAGVASAAPRKGKVVRVERERGAEAPPIICEVSIDRTAACIGNEPQPGDVITLVDENGTVGEARLTGITPLVLGQGGSTNSCNGLWQGKAEMLRGDLSNGTSRTVGIIDSLPQRDVHLVPQERLVLPNGPSDRRAEVGFDRDGDKEPDVIVSQGSCDTGGSVCIDVRVRMGGRMERVRQMNLQNCGF